MIKLGTLVKDKGTGFIGKVISNHLYTNSTFVSLVSLTVKSGKKRFGLCNELQAEIIQERNEKDFDEGSYPY